MQIRVDELRRIIREAIQKHLEEDQTHLGQGHEDPSPLAQINHQGDGVDYDQMGKRITRRKRKKLAK